MQSAHELEETLVVVLVQLILIVLAARLAGEAAVRLRQPRAVGEIVAGLLLGPSLFGFAFPDLFSTVFPPDASAPMRILSQIGLILLMFQIGSDFEFGHLKDAGNKRAVLAVAAASLLVPLVTGFLLGVATAPVLAPGVDALTYSLFVAVALAITAVPILGRILREYSLTRTETGVIAITAAAANDVVGWILLGSISAFASAEFVLGVLSLKIVGVAALLAFLWIVGRPFVAWLGRRFPIGADGQVPAPLITIVLALIFAAGVCTQKLGIFTIFGGFLMGLLFHRDTAFVEAWRRQVGQFVLVFFLPIFFTYSGLSTDVLGLESMQDWMWCGAIFAGATASKVVPVYLAARRAGVPGNDAAILGVLMNTRALMELIVLNIGYTLGFIPQDVFTMLVIMAIGTTIMTGPLLQILLPRAGHALAARVEA